MLFIGLLPLAFVFVFFSVVSAQVPLTIEWKSGRLSVSAEGVPLAQILREVAALSGIEVEGLDALQEPTSVRFANLPLREGLRELLAGTDHVIVGDLSPPEGRPPTRVMVVARQMPAPQPARPPESAGGVDPIAALGAGGKAVEKTAAVEETAAQAAVEMEEPGTEIEAREDEPGIEVELVAEDSRDAEEFSAGQPAPGAETPGPVEPIAAGAPGETAPLGPAEALVKEEEPGAEIAVPEQEPDSEVETIGEGRRGPR